MRSTVYDPVMAFNALFGIASSSLGRLEGLIPLVTAMLCVLIYILYKVFWRGDYGIPVQRRLMCRSLTVKRDQLAIVPFWWSNLQVQRAINQYWKTTLARGASGGPSASGSSTHLQ